MAVDPFVSKNKPSLVFTDAEAGAVPAPVTPTGKFLKDDATWDTPAGGGGNTQSDTPRFGINGKPKVKDDFSVTWTAPDDCTIERVLLRRKIAGSGGQIVADVDLDGVTIFTTQANRPTVTAASGDNQFDEVTIMDVTAVSKNQVLTGNIDEIETGNAFGVELQVRVTYP